MTDQTQTTTEPVAFTQYRGSKIAELRPYRQGEGLGPHVSVSLADLKAGSPKVGDMIARNPANHNDQWLVAADYFAANFEPLYTTPQPLAIGLDREAVARVIDPAPWSEPRPEVARMKGFEGRRQGFKNRALAKADAIIALAAPAEGCVEHVCEWRLIAETQDAQYARVMAMIDAAREAGWAMMEVVDSIAWEKRQQFSDITARLAQRIEAVEVNTPACLPAAPTGETGS